MGLDMYLEADLYVGGTFDHRKAKGDLEFSVNGKEYCVPINTVSTITIQVGYWRKANAIHNWFVQNIQNGQDECQRSWIPTEKLKELRALVEQVLLYRHNIEKIDKVLPPTAGFFFGSIERDEWYFQDMEETIQIIDKALSLPDEYEIYYQASW